MNNSVYLLQSRSQDTQVILSVNIIKKQSSLYWHIYIGKNIDSSWEKAWKHHLGDKTFTSFVLNRSSYCHSASAACQAWAKSFAYRLVPQPQSFLLSCWYFSLAETNWNQKRVEPVSLLGHKGGQSVYLEREMGISSSP